MFEVFPISSHAGAVYATGRVPRRWHAAADQNM